MANKYGGQNMMCHVNMKINKYIIIIFIVFLAITIFICLSLKSYGNINNNIKYKSTNDIEKFITAKYNANNINNENNKNEKKGLEEPKELEELDLRFRNYIKFNNEDVPERMTQPDEKYYLVSRLDIRDYYDVMD